jgi:predicted phage tail protein
LHKLFFISSKISQSKQALYIERSSEQRGKESKINNRGRDSEKQRRYLRITEGLFHSQEMIFVTGILYG